MDYKSLLDTVYFGNTVQNYLIGVGMLSLGLLFRNLFSSIFIRLISQIFKGSEYKLTLVEYKFHLQRSLRFFLFLSFIFLAFNHLDFPVEWNMAPTSEFGVKMIMMKVYQVLMTISLTRVIIKIVVIFGEMLLKKAAETDSKQDDQIIPFAIEVAKIILVIIAILILLSTSFDLNVGSLVAGLGIGGLAIALAAKESLENLFGSFTIFFDKPFTVGDLIKIGDVEGVVERVGFRSTRIRTLEKSFLTVPNKKMIDSELDNLSLRTFRRVKFYVGVLYGTKQDVIKGIVKDIKQLLDEHPHTNQDAQVRFMDFGPSSLDIMVLYYIDTMDWNLYLEYKEEINFRIMEIVEKRGGDFAFPTQTIHLQQDKI